MIATKGWTTGVAVALLWTLAVLPTTAFGSDESIVEAPAAYDYQAELDQAYPADGPGGTAIVARGGAVLFRGAAGLANVELGVTLRPEMVFELGSITKQFTAAAILLLVESGKLSVDDKLSKFLPDYPTFAAEVDVEHLLTHTSGIVSYTSIPGHMQNEIHRDLSVEELVAVFSGRPLEFAPGERFAYNNSGYVLLGAIIEVVTGQSYAEFIRERIFEPLGMAHSYYGSNSAIIPGRVEGYDGPPGQLAHARYLSMTQPYSAGSLLSNVDDLLRWNTALFGGKVVSAESLKRMTTPYTLNSGEQTTYGYGLAVGDVRGHPAISHGGGIFGFVTHAIYLPEEDVFVAVLSNNPGAATGPGTIAIRMAAAAAGDPLPQFQRVPVSTEILQRYLGTYRIDDDTTRTVVLEDGKLFTQRSGSPRLEAIPASETRFFYQGSFTWFDLEAGEDGAMRMLMYQNAGTEAEVAERVSTEVEQPVAVTVDRAVLETYVGEFEIQPGFVLTVFLEGEALMAQATGQPSFRLWPESTTLFVVREVGARVEFHPGENGSVDALTLHQGGQIPAKRIK